MLEDDWRAAALPLFAEGLVDALEWSFDTATTLPAWAEALLDHYAAAGRLWGHGVTFSLLAAHDPPSLQAGAPSWLPTPADGEPAGLDARQTRWLERLAAERARRPYARVSEHLGVTAAGDLLDGPPLPAPLCEDVLAVGADRLRRLSQVAVGPVGVENLALCASRADALAQGPFLEALLETSGGWLLLDLHNLLALAWNFDLRPEELLETYPLARARALHLSGGSWSTPAADPQGRPFRRDTHDDALPPELLELLDLALVRCPDLELVVLERRGGTIAGPAAAERFRRDAEAVRAGCLARASADPAAPLAPPSRPAPPLAPAAERRLATAQRRLLELLRGGDPPQAIARSLAEEPAFAPFQPHYAAWEPRAVEVAAELVARWGVA